jgi:hypothetical protein
MATAKILQEISAYEATISDPAQIKSFRKQKEKELKKRYGPELEDLSINQGRILIKLIDRQTGASCYNLIKELRGGFNAALWQTIAVCFSSSLKKEYDPQNQDADIEKVVLEIEQRQTIK